MGPDASGLKAFRSSMEEPLVGQIIRSGELLHIELGAGATLELMQVSLFLNGFQITSQETGSVMSITWSPFTLAQEAIGPDDKEFRTYIGDRPLFRLEVTLAVCFLFAVVGPESDLEGWLTDISHAVSLLTKSLFPLFAFVTEPLQGVPSTMTRILAGYLMWRVREGLVAVVYGELHTHVGETALFVLYTNERCERRASFVTIGVVTRIVDRVGRGCTSFVVDQLSLCARTVREKELWLRALCNTKVKISHGAPDATDKDLFYFRDAVARRLADLEASECPEAGRPPVLQRAEMTSNRPAGDVDDAPAWDLGSPRSAGSRTEADAPPPRWLHVICPGPTSHPECGGCYELLPGDSVEGLPVYRHSADGARTVYSGEDGTWRIGAVPPARSSSPLGGCLLRHSQAHCGRLPHNLTQEVEPRNRGTWSVRRDDTFFPDGSIQVYGEMQFPKQLEVLLPPGCNATDCAGWYTWTPETLMHGMPLYCRSDGNLRLCLHSSREGLWHLARLGADDDLASWAYHPEPHGGRAPSQLPRGAWLGQDGSCLAALELAVPGAPRPVREVSCLEQFPSMAKSLDNGDLRPDANWDSEDKWVL